jgi:hypothetical protein
VSKEPGCQGMGPVGGGGGGCFAGSEQLFGRLRARFAAGAAETAGLAHSELEVRLEGRGRELLRSPFQDSLDLRRRGRHALPRRRSPRVG